MNPVKTPNLPQGKVKLAIVDGRLGPVLEQELLQRGINIVRTGQYPRVYDAISYHPDIMLHHIGDEYIIHAPLVQPEVLEALSGYGFILIRGASDLSADYPGNIAYNAARVGRFAFHNTRYTDPVLKAELEKRGVELVHVNQGYAKCSVSVINENCIITADNGIARAALEKGLEVLVIPPENKILLSGLKNGFIGGSTGLIDRNRWAAAGDFEMLEAASDIRRFLREKNIEIVSLSGEQITDIGSILPIMEE